MAQPEKLKQKHAQQVTAAHIQFENYKDEIIKKVVEEFAGSYQTTNDLKKIWRERLEYHPEREKFLLSKTNLFLLLLDDKHTYKSPCFLRTLVGLISDYLSRYICKKGISRNACTQELVKKLFTDNRVIQNKIKDYQKENACYSKKQRKQKAKIAKMPKREKVVQAINKKNQIQHQIRIQVCISGLVK